MTISRLFPLLLIPLIGVCQCDIATSMSVKKKLHEDKVGEHLTLGPQQLFAVRESL